ncbi:Poly(A)-specific ribonuclease PARN [Linum perenne]
MSKKQWLPRFSRALSCAYSSSSTSSFPLKHVTNSNFESSLAELRTHVRAADFVAIDLEMTGITSSPWRDSFEFDRSDVRYLKVKDSVDKFAVVQFGVSPFRWDSQRESFVAHPHNFFIFPREEILSAAPSHEFLCQTASLDFLAKYQFDFNTCIREGISYLSRGQEDEAMRRLTLQHERLSNFSNNSEDRDMPLINFTDVLFSERMKNKLSGWHTGLLQGTNHASVCHKDTKQQFQTVFFKLRPAISLKGFTTHQLNLIRMVTKKHFKDLVHVRIGGENSSSEQLVVYTDTENDKAVLLTEVKNEYHGEAEQKIKAAIGFRHVIDLLSSEKKLIVGHNCFLDIAHVYSKFLGPLPCTAEEFVSSLNKYFPYIVDTKVLLNSSDVLQRRMKKSSTSLSSAYLLLCQQITLGADKGSDLGYCPSVKIEVEMDETRSTDWNSGAKHEAGYDAFMTGCIFAQACNYLGVDFKLHSPPLNLALDQKLQKHINCLYLSWVNGDMVDLSTGKQIQVVGSKVPNKRFSMIEFENVVLIWRFPSKFKVREIKECICKVFGAASIACIFQVDESAVLVHFSKPEFVSEFLLLKETLEGSNDALSALHPLSGLLEGGMTRAAGYDTYKEICRSPVSRVLLADSADAIDIRCKGKVSNEGRSAEEELNANSLSCDIEAEEMRATHVM